MGTRFELTAVAETDSVARQAVQAGIREIQRIEALISSWQPGSQTSAVNAAAGVAPVRVDDELFQLVRRALKVSKLTRGAFDISFAGMDRLWRFDGSMKALPDSSVVAEARRLVDYRQIELNPSDTTIFLAQVGMRIGFGAIGKGYAANRAKILMQRAGARGGVVNAAGDLIAWGRSIRPEGWSVQLVDPKDRDKTFAWLPVKNGAVVTSGDYEKYAEINGVRYAHIIDPRTGYPTTGLKSVTIVCPDPELADALATAVFVLGKEEGLAFVNRLSRIECLLITDTDEILTSSGLLLNRY